MLRICRPCRRKLTTWTMINTSSSRPAHLPRSINVLRHLRVVMIMLVVGHGGGGGGQGAGARVGEDEGEGLL